MKTIYIEEKQWQDHTLNRELGRAVGDTGRMAGTCRQEAAGLWGGEDKVIDLAAWRAENLVEPDGPEAAEERSGGLGQYEGRALVRRRGKYRGALMLGELAATLAAAGVMAAMILRVLLF